MNTYISLYHIGNTTCIPINTITRPPKTYTHIYTKKIIAFTHDLNKVQIVPISPVSTEMAMTKGVVLPSPQQLHVHMLVCMFINTMKPFLQLYQ